MGDKISNGVVSSLGEGVTVAQQQNGDGLTLQVKMPTGADCILHWGLSRRPGGSWERPPASCWPQGTTAFDGCAVRTPFPLNAQGQREVVIHLDQPRPWKNLPFVIYFPRENRWMRNGGKDFFLSLPRPRGELSPEETLAKWLPEKSAGRQMLTLENGDRLALASRVTPEAVNVWLVCEAEGPLVLHWGMVWQFLDEWKLPPASFRPPGTTLFDQKAAQTPFSQREGFQYLELEFRRPAEGNPPRGINFVLFQPGGAGWLKSGGKDGFLALFPREADSRLGSLLLEELADQIIGKEMGAPSWTLMHRFRLCHELLDRAQNNEDALALLYAWLRFSALRQLDWQRSYNTKPSELGAAQDRLTIRLAGLYRKGENNKLWARLMLTTLGRGGEGQRVRDEILHIMHRHNVKEVRGSFLEEWHQKLHNNTTPDDLVICEAYLVFLRSNGALAAFYRTLEEGGVPRKRLQSFERAIVTDPIFYPDRQEALLHDFEVFLAILKSVHAGADFGSAAAAARERLIEPLQKQLDSAALLLKQPQPAVNSLMPAATGLREGLKAALSGVQDDAAFRDFLYLDLAVEEAIRGAIERQNLSQVGRNEIVDLVGWTLKNLQLSTGAAELEIIANHWAALGNGRGDKDWALHARSIVERAGRWVQDYSSALYQRLQPRAEFLGAAFQAEPWTVSGFSEEVIRGGPAFALSLLLRHLDPLLRKAAGLGGWQVISPAPAFGRVRCVGRLLDVQAERFPQPTLLLADAVAGTEEIPEGVTAVLTPDTPDLVCHLAVRARNSQVLLAACFEADLYRQLQQFQDRTLWLHVTPAGDVAWEEKDEGRRKKEEKDSPPSFYPSCSILHPSPFWVVPQDQFAPGIVGAKANNLNGLRGRLADWIHLPASLALPFGVFEKSMEDENREIREKYQALAAAVKEDPKTESAKSARAGWRNEAPEELKEELFAAWSRMGLPAISWEKTWTAITRVWTSQWNERAFLARARGVDHDSLRMAVLIQQVVEADYAFVIHTANPITGNQGEIFAEVVLGLGETLVGNYPGRALGFVCRKSDEALEILSYPGKSIGLYGRGVIFRSDSNGEDLEGYAGAGLYDSFLAEEPERRLLDYRAEKLVWDKGFRENLLRSIARVGMEVESLLGSPQDIEGAVAGGKFYVVQTRPQVGRING